MDGGRQGGYGESTKEKIRIQTRAQTRVPVSYFRFKRLAKGKWRSNRIEGEKSRRLGLQGFACVGKGL